MFPDSDVQQHSANIIAQSLYDSANEDGHMYQLLDEIIGHKKLKNALDSSKGYVVSNNGQQNRVKTTKGWEIQVQWKDGLRSYILMVDVKEFYPIELAEYAFANSIINEPAFAW